MCVRGSKCVRVCMWVCVYESVCVSVCVSVCACWVCGWVRVCVYLYWFGCEGGGSHSFDNNVDFAGNGCNIIIVTW